MKRVAATILTVVLTASTLVGCGNNGGEENLSNVDAEKYVTKLGEYKGLQLTGSATEITDEYVESYIDYMLENSKQPVAITEDRPVQTGDVVNIDYVGKKDGVAFDGGTAQGYDLTIGSGTFIDGFEDGLIGAKIGETVDLNLTFPENYGSEELAGQAVVFTVTVNSIGELVRPELNDEFVQSLGMDYCQNVEEFYSVVRQSLEDTANANLENELQTQIVEKLMEICEFTEEIPEEMYNYYKEQIDTNFVNSASAVGMEKLDYILNYYGMTEEQYNAEIETGALNSARQAIVCSMIAEKEGIEITDEELNTKIEENYANFGYESVEAYMESGNAEDYRDYLLTMEVLDFLVDNAVVTAEAAIEAETVVETETATEAE